LLIIPSIKYYSYTTCLIMTLGNEVIPS